MGPGIHADDAIADRALHLVMQYQARHTAWIVTVRGADGTLEVVGNPQIHRAGVYVGHGVRGIAPGRTSTVAL